VQTAVLLLGIALLTVTAYGDIQTRRIPNLLAAAVGALGLLRLVLSGDPSAAFYAIAASAAVFIATFLLFWRGLVGGGDAKLITATALLVGYHDLFHFLVSMSICGLLVTLAMLVTHRPSGNQLEPKARLAVPCGVAIAGGGIVTLLFQSSFIG
jgi:prepilin peptidase CpaA